MKQQDIFQTYLYDDTIRIDHLRQNPNYLVEFVRSFNQDLPAILGPSLDELEDFTRLKIE